MNTRIGLARQMAYYLADDPMPWPTLGEIMDALELRTGTAAGERLREARSYYGFRIVCKEVDRKDGAGKRDVYMMPFRFREAVKRTDGYKAWKRARLAAKRRDRAA